MRIVRFRGKFYIYERTDGKVQRTSLRTSDREEAQRRFADYTAALKRNPETIAEIIEAYMADTGGQKAGAVTARFNIKKLLPVFGHLRPDQVDRTLCRSYVSRRHDQAIKDGTIRRELAVLSAALHWSDRHTPAVVEMPAQPPPNSRHLTREQYRAFREASKQVFHLHVFVVVGYSTAGRASAVLELTWDRVDFERGVIRLGVGEHLRKGRATVPMTDAVREVLLDARKAATTDFVVEYGGKQVKSIKRAFKACAKRAGLPSDTSPHILRHSCAVHLAEAGISFEEIAQVLGHSNTATTFRTYARFSPSHLRKAINTLE